MKVYLLQHGDIADRTDVKIVGIYPGRAEAEEARSRALELPGFRDAPKVFSIDPYELGADYWITGFVSVRSDGCNSDENVTRTPVHPEGS